MRFLRRLKSLFLSDSPALIALSNVLASFLALASAPIVARAIGPAGRGETAAAIAAFAIVPIILAIGIPLEMRRLAALGKSDSVTRSARDLWLLATLPAIAMGILLDQTIFASVSDTDRILILVGISLSPLSMSWLGDLGILIARKKFRAVLLVRVAPPLIYLVLIMGGLALGKLTVSLVIVANIIGNISTCFLGWGLVRVGFRGERARHFALLKSGLTFAGSAIAEVASNRLPQLLVLPLIGATQSGYFAVAMTVASLPLSLGHAVGASYFTDVANSTGHDRQTREAEAVRYIAWLAALSCVGLALLTPVGIPWVFGPGFAPSTQTTLVAIVGSFGLTVAFVCSMLLAADNKGLRMTVAQIASLGVSIGLLCLLAPLLGSLGAAISTTIGYLTVLAVLLFSLGLPLRKVIPRSRDLPLAIRRLFR